jgi:predicted ester cyclase
MAVGGASLKLRIFPNFLGEFSRTRLASGQLGERAFPDAVDFGRCHHVERKRWLGREGKHLMSAEEDKRLALTVIEALNARDLSRWSPKLADDYAGEYPGVPVLNKTQSIGYNQRFVTAFPDLRFDVHRVLAQGDQVFAHWTVSGTQTERLATVTGRTIPPTRRRATVSGVLLTEVRDGEIVREYWYWDQLSLLDQLGIMEHPGLFLSHEGF